MKDFDALQKHRGFRGRKMLCIYILFVSIINITDHNTNLHATMFLII